MLGEEKDWEGTVEEIPELIPEGTHEAIVSSTAETESTYGMMIWIEFTLITEDEFNGERIKGVCNKKIHGKTKLNKWFEAITGRQLLADDKIRGSELLNKHCRVVVKHVQKEEGGPIFANVVDVLQSEKRPSGEDKDLPF